MIETEIDEDDPQLWEPRRTPGWAVPFTAVTGLAAVAALILSARSAAGGSGGWSALALLFAVLSGHAAGYGVYLGWCPGRRGPRMPETTATGTAFSYSRWGYYWYVSLVGLAVTGLTVFALLSFGNGVAGLLFAVCTLLVCLAGAAVAGLMLCLAPGRLTLTPDGLHHRSLSFTQYSPWSSVFAVEPVEIGHERAVVVEVEASEADRIRHYLPRPLRPEHPLLPSIVVTDTWLATDPLLVYETLWHYHANPDDRAELGTPAALERILHRRWTAPADG
ncbi:hypothetical protein [Actinoplanes utahensis]|nr:hypothetical protein [Actinoplanes utahensis]GIF27475.1 hypothetical protein Aut01nite_04610 [Actinoplanes utahensis]